MVRPLFVIAFVENTTFVTIVPSPLPSPKLHSSPFTSSHSPPTLLFPIYEAYPNNYLTWTTKIVPIPSSIPIDGSIIENPCCKPWVMKDQVLLYQLLSFILSRDVFLLAAGTTTSNDVWVSPCKLLSPFLTLLLKFHIT